MPVAFGVALLLAVQAPDASAQRPRFEEKVEVERVLVDVRVVDGAGRPVEGLGAADFRVKVDGKDVAIESARWVSGTEPYSSGLDPGQAAEARTRPAPPGRLIVFLFQKDLSPSRVGGLLRMQKEAAKLLDTLTPGDRVAVLSFDWHLKLWTDFTDDHDRLRLVVERSVMFQAHPAYAESPFPSLAANLDRETARRASSIEKGLRVLAEALEPLPGAKSLVLFGWGFGRLGRLGVQMEPDYEPASLALRRARVSVFCLDVTEADYHSLEVGLQTVADDTGGFYSRTHVFTRPAIDRLKWALAGHYELSFEKPAGAKRRREVSVGLVGRKGTVMTRRGYVDAPFD
jgi:VWFA-related protein